MPLFGAHMSIAGGLHKAILEARKYDSDTVQLFSKNASQWKVPDLKDEQVALFRKTLKESKLRYPTVHDSYLINLASPDDDLYRRSIAAFVVELERAERLGIAYLVTHPGAYIDSDEESGLRRIAQAIDEAHQRCDGFRVRILLETTAGQGTSLGHRFEHLASIMDQVAEPERLGVCFDTCHVFAAGYPLAPELAYRETMRAFNNLIGLKHLKLFHVNDSKKPLGSRVDRHARLGHGEMGPEPFRLLVNDWRFRGKPMILETPKEEGENKEMDAINLAFLRNLVENSGQSQAG